MKALNDLLEALSTDERVIAFRKLEAIIDSNEVYKNAYTDLLNKQKRMVQSEHSKRSSLSQDIESYQKALKDLENNPVIHQYLTLQEELNDLLQTITSMIEGAIKKPFSND